MKQHSWSQKQELKQLKGELLKRQTAVWFGQQTSAAKLEETFNRLLLEGKTLVHLEVDAPSDEALIKAVREENYKEFLKVNNALQLHASWIVIFSIVIAGSIYPLTHAIDLAREHSVIIFYILVIILYSAMNLVGHILNVRTLRREKQKLLINNDALKA